MTDDKKDEEIIKLKKKIEELEKKKKVEILNKILARLKYRGDKIPFCKSHLEDLRRRFYLENEDLVKEEEARFQKEKELSERAAAQNVKLAELKANIEEKLLAAPEERKTKFFKDTFDGLVKDYSKYLSQINEKIAENTEIVSNFEKIQKIR